MKSNFPKPGGNAIRGAPAEIFGIVRSTLSQLGCTLENTRPLIRSLSVYFRKKSGSFAAVIMIMPEHRHLASYNIPLKEHPRVGVAEPQWSPKAASRVLNFIPNRTNASRGTGTPLPRSLCNFLICGAKGVVRISEKFYRALSTSVGSNGGEPGGRGRERQKEKRDEEGVRDLTIALCAEKLYCYRVSGNKSTS